MVLSNLHVEDCGYSDHFKFVVVVPTSNLSIFLHGPSTLVDLTQVAILQLKLSILICN